MIVLQTIAVAFAMFSAVPVPQFGWNEKNMRYAMCAFPLIGLVCGGLWCLCGVLPLPGWLMHILNIVINILRSVPFLILMICVFPLTRAIVGTTVGTKATIVPLVVAAFPFVARLVETSLRELDEGVVEAAQSMGATPFQIITKVMIPECLPGLISSMTTALTTILGYSAMSGVIGGGGLGKIALSYGYYRYQTNIMIVCVVLLVLMVQVFQTVGTFWATRSDKRLRK